MRRQLTNNGTIRTFDSSFVERCGLNNSGPPAGDGTIFLEETTSNVYVIKGGAKTLIPNWNNATLSQMFPGYLLRRVWQNALSHIPDPRIPRPPLR